MVIKENNYASYSRVEHGTSTVSFHFAEVKYSYCVVVNVHNEYEVYVLLFQIDIELFMSMLACFSFIVSCENQGGISIR